MNINICMKSVDFVQLSVLYSIVGRLFHFGGRRNEVRFQLPAWRSDLEGSVVSTILFQNL